MHKKYVNENFGKRMKETAERLQKWVSSAATVLAILEVISGIVLVAEDSDLVWALFVSLAVAAGTYLYGQWLAELAYVRLYGIGVAVDRMENLKPEYFVDTEEEKPAEKPVPSAPAAPEPAAATPTGTAAARLGLNTQTSLAEPIVVPQKNEDGSWNCPACGTKNRASRKVCFECGLRIAE